jgi:hypothetical protein
MTGILWCLYLAYRHVERVLESSQPLESSAPSALETTELSPHLSYPQQPTEWKLSFYLLLVITVFGAAEFCISYAGRVFNNG